MTEEIRTNTILNGRYLVQKELGQGGMGAVYLAQDMQNRRPVAIKVARLLGPEARAQFQREAVYLQKLHHHSLPRVWDYFSDTQRDFLVMEYIPGEDLETFVLRKGPQPEWLVLRWADELLDGLEYLHGQSPPIIHRDVKPSNLKARQDETLVLVDFGIAKEYVPGMDTLPGASAVTPGYSPPEQYSNIVTDARSDVYSVGATMYFLLTARHPAPAPERASGDRKLLPPSQFIPELSTGTEMAVRKALSLPRDERWTSAAGMRRALAQTAQQLTAQKTPPKAGPAKAPPAPPAPPANTPRAAGGKSRLPILIAAIVSLLAVAAIAAFVLRSGPEPPATPVATAPVVVDTTSTKVPLATEQTARPTVAVALAETPTQVGPAPTASGLITPTAPSGGGDVPTSTPIPTRAATPIPPTVTLVPTTRAPVAATPTAPVVESPPTASGNVSVGLLSPNNGDVANGNVTFNWAITAGALPANQALEVILWPAGQDAMRYGVGLAPPTRGNSATADLAALDANPSFPLEPGNYLWGVRLIQLPSGLAIRMVSEPRQLRYERPQAPTDTPEPDPTLPPF